MNTGVLFLDAGELLSATRAVERWNPSTVSRTDARTVVGLLESGHGRSTDLLRKWKARLAMETVQMESQDLETGNAIHFPKQNEIHELVNVGPTPTDVNLPTYIRLQFKGWQIDAPPSELFAVVLD